MNSRAMRYCKCHAVDASASADKHPLEKQTPGSMSSTAVVPTRGMKGPINAQWSESLPCRQAH
eukprot:7692650-Alexandrium_andersonii.AAC.1